MKTHTAGERLVVLGIYGLVLVFAVLSWAVGVAVVALFVRIV